jgi:hypothetical protein
LKTLICKIEVVNFKKREWRTLKSKYLYVLRVYKSTTDPFQQQKKV